MTEVTRRNFLKSVGVGTVAAALPADLLAAAGRAKLNFVFILVDDMGWTDAACFGSKFFETPNIDALAQSGMRFTAGYAACPVCSPTRASIMTGKYPARMATTDYFGAPQPDGVPKHWTKNKPLLPAPYEDRLPLAETTMAEAFGQAGYRTFFAGKWHLGPEGFYPEDQGFDVNKGGHRGGGPYGGKKYFSPYGNPRLDDGPDGEHLPDRLATETVRFIEDCGDAPFLAYLSFYSVHTPLMARADLQAKYEKKAHAQNGDAEVWGAEGERKARLVQDHAVYAGMIEAMDQAVGTVLDGLKRLGRVDNTAIIFMSDNGGLSTSEGHPTSNLPLRAGKGWTYEGGIREPWLIRWPGVTEAGSVCACPVISTDFYPTMLEMARLPMKNEQHLDGVSLVSLLCGEGGVERDALYWHYPHYGNQGGSPSGAIRAGDWKLIEFFEDGRVELYNLADDIGERNDLAQAEPKKAAALGAQLHAWQKEIGARFPTPNPAFEKK